MALINDFLSLIYPRKCETCSQLLFKHENFICNYCKISLPKSDFHLKRDNPIAMAFGGRVPTIVAASFYIFEKKGRVQKLLHAIKYENQKKLAVYLGKDYGNELREANVKFDLIIPIPLHPRKEKARGYNQSALFSEGLGESLGITVESGVLLRETETSTQTRKRKFARWENVEGVFSLKNPQTLEGKHILLVDDVVTTGATIEAAWEVLKEIRDIKVSVAAIAYATR